MLHVGSGRVSARCGSLVRVAAVVVSASVLTPLLVPVVSAVTPLCSTILSAVPRNLTMQFTLMAVKKVVCVRPTQLVVSPGSEVTLGAPIQTSTPAVASVAMQAPMRKRSRARPIVVMGLVAATIPIGTATRLRVVNRGDLRARREAGSLYIAVWPRPIDHPICGLGNRDRSEFWSRFLTLSFKCRPNPFFALA